MTENRPETTIDMSLKLPPTDAVWVDDEIIQVTKVAQPGYSRMVVIDPNSQKGAVLYVKRAAPSGKPKSKVRNRFGR